MLNGWVDLVFENGDKVRIQEGDSIYIPGGLRHNETATSEAFELLEVTVPANMGTTSCEPPAGMAE
jgi:mannose-6-phosphate isomerase-like protein (cupin superfamily)